MGQQWDQGRNQKIPWNKCKWDHNNSKSLGHSEGNPKRENIALKAYLKKTRKSSNKNLTPHLKEPEKEQQRLKWVEGKK